MQAKRDHSEDENSHDFGNEEAATKNYGYGGAYAGNGHHRHHGVGYSIGSGLVSIAQGAADQANTAIQNQHVAGGQAAFQAKNNLAQNAAAAAATAQAALAGKQVIVSNLEQQHRDTQGQVEAEALQLTQAQRAALATQQSAQHAQAQVWAHVTGTKPPEMEITYLQNITQIPVNQLHIAGRARHIESTGETDVCQSLLRNFKGNYSLESLS